MSDAAALAPAERLPTTRVAFLLNLPERVGGGGGSLQQPVVCLALAAVHCSTGRCKQSAQYCHVTCHLIVM